MDKQENVQPPWSLKLKIIVSVVVLSCYAYLIIFFKTLYFKNQKLNAMMGMADGAAELITRLQVADDQLLQMIDEAEEA